MVHEKNEMVVLRIDIQGETSICGTQLKYSKS